MKKLFLFCAAFLSFVQCPLAADAIGSDPVSPSYVTYDWSGFYLGVNGGYAWADTETSENSITTTGALLGLDIGQLEEDTYFGPDRSGTMEGGFGGIQAGYNFQHNSWVYGVEADYQYASVSGSESFLGSPEGPTYETSAELRHFGTLRGRLGYAFDTVLIYGTGGLAVGRLETDVDITGGLPGAIPPEQTYSAGDERTVVGYTIGAGVEAAIARSNWTVKAEYLYADLGGEDIDLSFPDSGGSTAFAHTDVDVHLLRVGLNYRF